MRFIAARIARIGVASAALAAASACVPVERGTVEIARVNAQAVGTETVVAAEIIRADPEEIAERAVIGGIVGGMLGAGLAATASANPAFGAMIGGPAGAVLGAAVGIATVRPLPSYAAIPVPEKPIIPEFYDTWPPGFRAPPVGSQLPPPSPDWTPRLAANPLSPAAAEGTAPAVYAPPPYAPLPRAQPGEAPPPPINVLPASPL